MCTERQTSHSTVACVRFSVLNISEETDSRLKYGWTTTPRSWSHEEILSFITNNGENADPEEVKSLKVQDPEGKADYFVEGGQ